MPIQLDIYGSTVCRDLVRYLSKEEFEINRCIGDIPVSTLYEAPVLLNEEKLTEVPASRYDKKMLKIQAKRTAPRLLKKSHGEMLIIDLAAECMQRYQYGNTPFQSIAYLGSMDRYIEKICHENDKKDNNNTHYFPMDIEMDMEIVEQKYKTFIREIVRSEDNPNGYSAKNIVVIKSLFAEHYVENKNGILRSFGAEYRIKEKNEWLNRMYNILFQCVPECQVIMLPRFTHASENHLRGIGPLSYTNDTYEYLVQVLTALCGLNKINSINNLYQERSLSNKLYTRLLGATSINKIHDMKKQIHSLEKQVEKLQKQIDDLKKKI